MRSARSNCRHSFRWLGILAFLAVLLCARSLPAQQSTKDKPPEKPVLPLFGSDAWGQQRGVTAFFGAGFGSAAPLSQAVLLDLGHQLRFWDLSPPLLRGEARTPVGAISVVLSGISGTAPLSELAYLRAGDFSDCWSLIDSLRVRTLDPQVLGSVRDDLPLPDEQTASPAAVQESFALNDALLKVMRSPRDQFEKVALASVSANLLTAQPQRFRGLVVRLDGRLKRVVRKKAPPLLEQYGIKYLYEAWILSHADGTPKQACLLTPFLPPGFKVGDVDGKGPTVAIAGYSFKKYRFPAKAGIKGFPGRTAPLLVGHLFAVIGPELRTGLAAASILTAGFSGSAEPLQQLDLFLAGERSECWTIKDPLQVPRLTRRYLDAIKDKQPLPTGFEESDEKSREADAYFEAVIEADRTPTAAFRRAARKDVTLAMLFEEPGRYRGEVVVASGRLRRVTELPPMQMVRQAGVQHLYEVWLINDKFGFPNPVVLICTRLPPGIKVTEEVQSHVPVTFVGYFFKKYRYRSADDPKKPSYRDVPLLIGHLVYQREQRKAPPGWTGLLLPIFFAVIIGTFLLVFSLNWFFRRADRRVRTRLDAAASLFVNAPEPEQTPPPNPLPEAERGRRGGTPPPNPLPEAERGRRGGTPPPNPFPEAHSSMGGGSEEVPAPPLRFGEGVGGRGSEQTEELR